MKPTRLTPDEISYWVGSNSTKPALARAIESAVNQRWMDLLAKQEPVARPKTAQEISDFIGSNFISRSVGEPNDNDQYKLTAHDLLSAFSQWAESANPLVQESKDDLCDACYWRKPAGTNTQLLRQALADLEHVSKAGGEPDFLVSTITKLKEALNVKS